MAKAKKSTSRRSSKKAPAMQSFKPSPDEKPFITSRVNNQTVYWLIVSLLVLIIGAWSLVLMSKSHRMYDKIDSDAITLDQANK